MKIIQLLDTVSSQMPVTKCAYLVDCIAKEQGWEVVNYARQIESTPENFRVEIYKKGMTVGKDDLLVLHFDGDGNMFHDIGTMLCRKVLFYYGLVDPALRKEYDLVGYERMQGAIGRMMEWAEQNLFEKIFTFSAIEEDQLLQFGCEKEKIVRIDDFDSKENSRKVEPDEDTLEDFNREKVNLLYLGEVVPEHQQHELLRILACFQQHLKHASRLIMVGGGTDTVYGMAVRKYIRTLGLKDVYYYDEINSESMEAILQRTDVYISAAKAENTEKNIREIMERNIPVVAYPCMDLEKVMDNKGVLLESCNPLLAAKWIERILSDEQVRRLVCRIGAPEQRHEVTTADIGEELRQVVAGMAKPAGKVEQSIGADMYDLIRQRMERQNMVMTESREQYLAAMQKPENC